MKRYCARLVRHVDGRGGCLLRRQPVEVVLEDVLAAYGVLLVPAYIVLEEERARREPLARDLVDVQQLARHGLLAIDVLSAARSESSTDSSSLSGGAVARLLPARVERIHVRRDGAAKPE